MLEHVHHRVPVTALAFCHDNVILAGEGRLLRAYDIERQNVLATLIVFDGQAVHGLLTDNNNASRVLAYGGRYVRSVTITVADDHTVGLELGGLFDAEDWILDAAHSPMLDGEEGQCTGFVTAHNALAVVPATNLVGHEPDQATKLDKIVQSSNCILYAAHITWLSDSHCLIASGTAFGDVLVWSCFLSVSEGALTAHEQTHYTFSAHEGSIFGVRISEQLSLGQLGECKRALATCSDDRTIRLWDISDLTTQTLPLMQVHRDTGFGSDVDDDSRSPTCLAKAMGHVSRIWHVRFLRDGAGSVSTIETESGDPSRLLLMSFGEDASNIPWNVIEASAGEGSSPPYTLQRVHVQTAHIGKNIWTSAQDSTGRIVTGGADGAIAIRPNSHRCLIPAELGHDMPGRSDAKDSIKAYGFVSPDVLICTSSTGRIMRLHLGEDGSERAEEVSSALSGLKGYSILASIPGYAFVAGTDGCVYAYTYVSNTLTILDRATAKVSGLFACRTGAVGQGDGLALLVTCVGTHTARVIFIDANLDANCTGAAASARCEIEINDDVVTSFTYMPMHDHKYAIIGCRNGSVCTYDVSVSPEHPITRCSHHTEAHGREAVTALDALHHADGHYYIHSTGRDGMHAILRFHKSRHTELVHQLMLPFGPNIEGLSLSPDNHLRVWGFRHTQFVVYDATNSRDIMVVDCGGAHRNWTYDPAATGGTFVWTKASKVYRYTQTRLPYDLIGHGGHGREIKTAAVMSVFGLQVAATGSEDTNIKLHVTSNDDDSSFRCVQTLRKHTTGIQHIQLSPNGTMFSSGGFEELFVWQIRLNISGVGLGVVCVSTHPRSGTSDLRIMGFFAAPWAEYEEDLRSGRGDGSWFVDMVYSDSTLKRWKYVKRLWELVQEGDYLTACLTNVRALSSSGTLVTTATDGHLVSWTSHQESPLSWSKRHKIHQNAILSITVGTLSDGSSLIFTGGDDNAIGITRWANDSDDVSTLLVPRAHAAAVTGLVSAVSAQKPSAWILLSTSIDQRLKLWTVNVNTTKPGVQGVEVKLIYSVHTAVADVSSLDFCSVGNGNFGALICGVGMDVWKLPVGTS